MSRPKNGTADDLGHVLERLMKRVSGPVDAAFSCVIRMQIKSLE
jgi:hypothetical protein